MATLIIDERNKKIVTEIPNTIQQYLRNLKVPHSVRSDGYIIIDNADSVDKAKLKTDLGLTE